MRINVANVHAMRLIDWQIQSSPHVRGTLETLAQLVFERGIIPACARDTCRVAGSPACRGDHPRMCGEHANVCVFMTYLQQNLLAYPEHLSMLQNPIQHWFSCFSLHQFCFCLAGCHDALRPRRHTACSFSPPTSDSQEISLKNNLSCDGMCGMIGISQASCVCSIEVRPMGAAPFCWTASI